MPRVVVPRPSLMITGEVDGILVEGGFRGRFNINAIIRLDSNMPALFVSIETLPTKSLVKCANDSF